MTHLAFFRKSFAFRPASAILGPSSPAGSFHFGTYVTDNHQHERTLNEFSVRPARRDADFLVAPVTTFFLNFFAAATKAQRMNNLAELNAQAQANQV